MADGITIPVTGTGDTTPKVYTDDLSSPGHAQFMKLLDGALDSTTKLRVVAEDAASADGDTGIIAMVVRKDSPANTSGTDGDFEYLQVSGGCLWTRPISKLQTISVDVTRPADTTAYTVDDALSDSTSAPTTGGFTISGAARASGGAGTLIGFSVASSADPATPLAGEVVLFNQAVTAINDNAAFAVSDSEAKTLIEKLGFGLQDIGNNDFFGSSQLNVGFTCVGTANLRFLVRVKNTYTPASAEVLTFTFRILWLD